MDSIETNNKEFKTPLVSVVMGCYNSSEYIREAIDSILLQTIADFEFIIIDDCSKDNTVDIIKSYDDPRIILVQNEQNMGLGYSLNIGVSMSKGKYIARMDADDISLPERFERQVHYLEMHPDTLVLGTAIKSVGDISLYARLFYRFHYKPQKASQIRVSTLFGAAFYHPSVMFNASLMKARNYNYNPDFRKAQDYELWSRIVWGNEIANLKEALVCYRSSKKQASHTHHGEQVNNVKTICSIMFEDILKWNVNELERKSHFSIIADAKYTLVDVDDIVNWSHRLYQLVCSRNDLDSSHFIKIYKRCWIAACRSSLPMKKRIYVYRKIEFVPKFNILDYLRLIRDY